MRTFELEWLIGIGLSALVLGLLLGLAMGRTVFRSKKDRDTEAELATAQEALKDYRAEVYDQFAETARKFDSLNHSYNDLHRHLASSANVLLGDGVNTPLLRGPGDTDSTDSGEIESEIEPAPVTPEDVSATADNDIEGQAEAVDPQSPIEETASSAETPAAEPAEVPKKS